MEFKVKLFIGSQKKGVELDDEYDRLGFPEINTTTVRPQKLSRSLTVPVSKEFARRHPQIFDGALGTVHADITRTSKEDWEDWGSGGVMLSRDAIDEKRLAEIAGI